MLQIYATNCSGCTLRRLFIYDPDLDLWFLIDTGADVSIVPARHRDRVVKDSFKLYAANGTIIDTYGERSMQVSLGLRRACTWRFVVADVQYAIIVADFLTHHELLPDLKNGCLVDGKTLLYAVGSMSMSTTHPSPA